MSQEETNMTKNESAIVEGNPSQQNLNPDVPEILSDYKLDTDSESFKKAFSGVGTISIKPFVDANSANMGLEKYNMSMFPGTHLEEQLAAIDQNGVIRFITGLDEFSTEVRKITDKTVKEATIKNIRSTVAYLEKILATNIIEIDDKDFWNKVTLLKPENFDFWGKISIICKNEPTVLNPLEDGYDLIKLIAIEAGGFTNIAKSYEDALNRPVAPKFYLDKELNTIAARADGKRLHNKAVAALENVTNKFPKKLLYLAKVLDTGSSGYKATTPTPIVYDVLDNYINGLGVESNKAKASERFLETVEMDMETLKLKAIIKDAAFFKIIDLKADGNIYHVKSGTMVGKNVADVLLYFKNPLNEEIMMLVMKEVERYWTL